MISRSNYDKPFYVDVGTSIVAVRCASNRDVVLEYDHSLYPFVVKLAKDVCDRMNKEAEIGKPLRNCDVGTAEEQTKRMRNNCNKYKPSCIGCKHVTDLQKVNCWLAWAQMPYEEEEGGER